MTTGSALLGSRLGLGTWAFGGEHWTYGWGPQDPRGAVATVRRAVESGVRWLDTAPVYGYGRAEELVGAALAGVPQADRPAVVTKCGVVWDEPGAADPRIGRRDSIERELAASLRRLRVDCVDLYLMHWPAGDGTPLEDYWLTLADLRRKGLVKACGLSNHGLAELRRAHAVAPLDVIEPPFSALRRGAADSIAWCAANGIGVLAYSPLQSGLLTGEYNTDAVPVGDWRARDPAYSAAAARRVVPLLDACREVADRYATTVSAVAVAWVLAWPGVTGAIVGARRPEQVDGWSAASRLRLSTADLDGIARAIERHDIGDGPARPAARAPTHTSMEET